MYICWTFRTHDPQFLNPDPRPPQISNKIDVPDVGYRYSNGNYNKDNNDNNIPLWRFYQTTPLKMLTFHPWWRSTTKSPQQQTLIIGRCCLSLVAASPMTMTTHVSLQVRFTLTCSPMANRPPHLHIFPVSSIWLPPRRILCLLQRRLWRRRRCLARSRGCAGSAPTTANGTGLSVGSGYVCQAVSQSLAVFGSSWARDSVHWWFSLAVICVYVHEIVSWWCLSEERASVFVGLFFVCVCQIVLLHSQRFLYQGVFLDCVHCRRRSGLVVGNGLML